MGSTVPVWVAVLLGLMSPIVAVVALVVGEMRDRRRFRHDVENTLRGERIAAYRKMLLATRLDDDDERVEAIREARAEVSLLAGTKKVRSYCNTLLIAYLLVERIGKYERPKDTPEAYRRAQVMAERRTAWFEKLVREDLGVEGLPPGELPPGVMDADWPHKDEEKELDLVSYGQNKDGTFTIGPREDDPTGRQGPWWRRLFGG